MQFLLLLPMHNLQIVKHINWKTIIFTQKTQYFIKQHFAKVAYICCSLYITDLVWGDPKNQVIPKNHWVCKVIKFSAKNQRTIGHEKWQIHCYNSIFLYYGPLSAFQRHFNIIRCAHDCSISIIVSTRK